MVEVADVFREYGEAYRKQHALPLPALKAMNAIESCRTAELGGHVSECSDCGHLKIAYNSCRNRHCPKCQNLQKERWVEDRKDSLLPIPYFHVVFTLPQELRALALRNKREIYGLLLRASSQTLQTLAADPKHLGAQIGFISIVHTWGQNLLDHPHVHCIVTGGGLSPDQKKWIPSKSRYLFPIQVMSKLFRGKFLQALKQWLNKGEGVGIPNAKECSQTLSELYGKNWVVYCKPPFAGPEHVLSYLGRYTHKVAISNQRIICMKNGQVTFQYRDYRDGSQNKTMTLSAFEFIRRYLLHILPSRFVKIRHYGILSTRNKGRVKLCKKLLYPYGPSRESEEKPAKNETWVELLIRITGLDPILCPVCKKGKLIVKQSISPKSGSPPAPNAA